MTDEHDPVAMAKRIRANEKRHVQSRHRQWVITIFVLGAFLLLAYRTEYTNNLVTSDQKASCARGNAIITDFNLLEDRLIAIERTNMSVTQAIRDARIAAYEDARVLPIPSCPRRMTP